MAVERLVQRLKLGEKPIIEESMFQLMNLISENKKTQEEIIKFLPESEITKMMTYMEDPDPFFRKLTAKFFLDLVYGNFGVQQIFCDVLGILPCDGKVCINRIPDAFKRTSRSLAECLEILKKVSPEETREILPYCWYVIPDDTDHSEKIIEFMSESEKIQIEDLDNFVDPLYAMIGFVVKVPKMKKSSERTTECSEKCLLSKENDTRKASIYSVNAKTVNITNHSLDYSLHSRLLNDSKTPEKDITTNASPVRALTANSTTTTASTRISYPRNTKNKGEPLISTSICNSERLAKNQLRMSTEGNIGLAYKSGDRDINQVIGLKRYSIQNDKMQTLSYVTDMKDKKSPVRESEYSLDFFEQMQNSKVIASNSDSQEFGMKFLESSSSNPASKGALAARVNDRSIDISHYKVANERKVGGSKKSLDKSEKSKSIKSKALDLDKGFPKSFRDNNNNSSISASITPKNNLLSKLLKEKPLGKEVSSATKHSKAKQETKRLNTTTSPSTSLSKHNPQKLSLGLQQHVKAFGKIDGEYANKKYAFHSSLLKSIDMSDNSHGMLLIDEKEESTKENLNQEESQRKQSAKSGLKNKTYNLSSILKASTSTPRTPTDILKSTLTQNSKILNVRKSHDTSSYLSSLSRDKRKSDVAIPLQNLKNRQIELNGHHIVEFSLDHTNSITPKTYELKK